MLAMAILCLSGCGYTGFYIVMGMGNAMKAVGIGETTYVLAKWCPDNVWIKQSDIQAGTPVSGNLVLGIVDRTGFTPSGRDYARLFVAVPQGIQLVGGNWMPVEALPEESFINVPKLEGVSYFEWGEKIKASSVRIGEEFGRIPITYRVTRSDADTESIWVYMALMRGNKTFSGNATQLK